MEVINAENAKKDLLTSGSWKSMSVLALKRYYSQIKIKIFCNKIKCALFLYLIVFVVLRQSCATQVLAR